VRVGEQGHVVSSIGEAAGERIDDALDAAVLDGRNRQLGIDGEGDTQGLPQSRQSDW
jgi:hypothetical protein